MKSLIKMLFLPKVSEWSIDVQIVIEYSYQTPPSFQKFFEEIWKIFHSSRRKLGMNLNKNNPK